MKMIILIGLLIAVALAFFFSPFASQSPDGLEKVAEDEGFLHKGEGQEVFSAPIPDYAMPNVKHEGLATSLAGLVGTVLTFGVAFGLGYLIRRKAKDLVEKKEPQR